MKRLFALALWKQILLGMLLGIAVGLIFREDAAVLKPLGDFFIRLIKMLIVPLVLFTLISGVTSLGDPAALGRMGLKALILYVLTAAAAISIGLVFAEFFRPGDGLSLAFEASDTQPPPEARGFADSVLEMIPTNPLAAMVEGNMLQIITVALLFGLAASMTKKKAQPFIEFCNSASEVCFTLTLYVMRLAPFGIFGMLAWVTGTQDMEVLISLGRVLLVFIAAVAVHVAMVFGGILYFLLRINPLTFITCIKEALIMAFTTSSSSATLPVTMEVVEYRLGVSPVTTGFALPLGATVNMNGSALYQGVCAAFIAQAIGVDLTFSQYVTITLTSILAAIGTAGIPGAGLLMLTLVLTSVGLPAEAIAILLGIERIMDMIRTMINVAGDALVALALDISEGRFDRQKIRTSPLYTD